MLSFDRACVLLGRRSHTLTCSHEFMLSSSSPHALLLLFPHALVQEGVGSCFGFFCLISLIFLSALAFSPLPLPSNAKAYAPSVTRFPFLLVQVSCEAHFRGDVSRAGANLPNTGSPTPRTSPRAFREAPRARKEVPREPQRRFKNTKIVLSHAHILILS